LALSDEEVERYGSQLEDLLKHVDDLKQLDTSDVAATAQVIESRNVMRPDTLVPCLDHDVVMAGAPQPQHGFFRVPKNHRRGRVMDPVRASARDIARAVNAREISAVEIAETMIPQCRIGRRTLGA